MEHATAHLPKSYEFFHGPVPQRTVCPIEDRPGVYWYTPGGVHLDHTFAISNPTEFDIGPLRAMKGFSVTASFGGAAPRVGALEVVYFTDRFCSDAGVEFGFTRDLVTNGILVYWSIYANCGNDAASLCRKTDNPSLGENFANVQQENGGSTSDHGFMLYGLDVETPHTYRMFVEQSAFRIEVLQGEKPAQCALSESGERRPCSFLKRVQPWFPIERIERGYVVAGTQTVGDPGIAEGSRLDVSDILVAK